MRVTVNVALGEMFFFVWKWEASVCTVCHLQSLPITSCSKLPKYIWHVHWTWLAQPRDMCVWPGVQVFGCVSVCLIWKVYCLLLSWVIVGERWHFHPSGPLPTHASFPSSGALSSLVAMQGSTLTDKTLHISILSFRGFYAIKIPHGFTPDPFLQCSLREPYRSRHSKVYSNDHD